MCHSKSECFVCVSVCVQIDDMHVHTNTQHVQAMSSSSVNRAWLFHYGPPKTSPRVIVVVHHTHTQVLCTVMGADQYNIVAHMGFCIEGIQLSLLAFSISLFLPSPSASQQQLPIMRLKLSLLP